MRWAFAEAERDCDAFVRLDPDNVDAYTASRGAVADLERVLATEPGDAATRALRGPLAFRAVLFEPVWPTPEARALGDRHGGDVR